MSSLAQAEREESSLGPKVLVETSRELPLVSLTIALRTGANLDPPQKHGLTRFVARLMRRTGGGLSPQILDTQIDSLGGALGAEVTHSSVAFHGTVIRRSLDAFVALLVQILAQPGFSEDEHTRLKRETDAELIELLDNDRAIAQRNFHRRLFQDHTYGRPVAGTPISVEGFSADDVERLYRSSWVAQNLVFAFAGDIDQSEAAAIAGRVVEALSEGPAPSDDTPDPRGPSDRSLLIVDKPQRTQTQILIGSLGTHPKDDDHLALHVANTVFGGTFTARLTQEVRSKRGWSYGAYSSLPYDRRRQAFSMWTFPKATDAADCIRLELQMLREFCERGITARELSWAKRYLTRSHAFSIDTASKRVGMALDSLIYELPQGYFSEYVSKIKAVTLDQANAAVARRLSWKDLLICVMGTASEIGAPIRDAIEDLSAVDIVPFDKRD